MELARELRNNLHPHPSAHSPYGNSTLSPGSQGLPPDSSVLALFNASATDTRQLLPLASNPPSVGLGVRSPRTYLPKQTFFTVYYRCKTVTYISFLLFLIFPENIFLSPVSSPSAFGQFLFLTPVSFSPQDEEGSGSRN